MASRIEQAIQERQMALDKLEERRRSPAKSISHRNLPSGQRGDNAIVNIQVSEHTGE